MFLCALLLTLAGCVLGLGGALQGMEDTMEIQRQQLERFHDFMGPRPEALSSKSKRQSPIVFSNPAAEQFFVDGTTIPDGTYSRLYFFAFFFIVVLCCSKFRCRPILVGSYANI